MDTDTQLTLGAVALAILTQLIHFARYELQERRKATEKNERRRIKLQAAMAGVTLKDSSSEVSPPTPNPVSKNSDI